ncbi:MAG: hypothetical protein PHQ35_11575, partial [Phycisphaerae bacterium]|nr:hypothetical protein [Phycisphaerae bacterium]
MALFPSLFGKKVKPLFGQTQQESVYAPYVPQAAQEEEEKRKRFSPMQWIFDRLSTGQYVVANLVDEILTSAKDGDTGAKDFIDVLKAMGEGVIGSRKGDFQDVLKKHLPETPFTQEPIMTSKGGPVQQWIDEKFPSGKERREARAERGGFMSKATYSDVLGFMANIFLDPTTYLSFGTTKGAEAAAKSFADDAMRLVSKAVGTKGRVAKKTAKAAIQGLSGIQDDILNTAIKGYEHAKFKGFLKKSPEKAIKYFQKHVKNMAQVNDLVYQSAYKTALQSTPEALQGMMKARLGISPELTGDALQEALSKVPGELEDIATRAVGGYGGAGTTKIGNFFGKELGVRARTPAQTTATALTEFAFDPVGNVKAMTDEVGKMFTKAFPGLPAAFWSINNRGLIGGIRKGLGIRSPYQKYLRQIELQAVNDAEFLSNGLMRRYVSNKVAPEADAAAQWFIEQAEQSEKQTWKAAKAEKKLAKEALADVGFKKGAADLRIQSGQDILAMAQTRPELLKGMPAELQKAVLENPDDVATSIDNMQNLLRDVLNTERQWTIQGFAAPKEIKNYIPKAFRKQAPGAGLQQAAYAQKRQFSRVKSKEMIVSRLKKFFGLSDQDATELFEQGATDYATNIDELMASRLMAHAKMESKVNMLKKFKELGIPEKNIGKSIVASGGGNVVEMGLREIPHPALKGILFDQDVAEILERAVKATSGREAGVLQRVFGNITQWWKGLVTMTTGFHIRNFHSNNFTGFMKHGTKWFNMNKYSVPALVGTIHALRMTNPVRFAEQMGIDEGTYSKILNRVYGEGNTAKT